MRLTQRHCRAANAADANDARSRAVISLLAVQLTAGSTSRHTIGTKLEHGVHNSGSVVLQIHSHCQHVSWSCARLCPTVLASMPAARQVAIAAGRVVHAS
jgi:hypothetical protein